MINNGWRRIAVKKTKKRHRSVILKIVILVACVIFAVQLIQYQIEINSSKKTLEDLNEQLREQTIANEELERNLETGYDDEGYERLIRDGLGYGYPDEKVFVEIAED